MAVSHGMDVGEVRRLGGSLQTSAGSIDDLIKRIETAVAGSTWIGPDATMFKGTWWPEHRAHLKGMSETLRGLGQSALNNATEQEQASGAAGGNAGGGSPAVPGGQQSPAQTTIPSAPSPSGGVVVSSDDVGNSFADAWRNGKSEGADPLGFLRPPSGGNCTSYVAWRLNNLAEANGLDWSMDNRSIGGQVTHLGNANNWDDAVSKLDVPMNGTPTPGSVAQWNEPSDLGGHVAIVRSVDSTTGTITVEESSWKGYIFRTREISPGDADYPERFIHMLPES